MDYEKLKEVIAKKIKENGRGEITGPILQAVLMAMVDSLGEVYPQTYTDEQKAQARANIDALSNYDGEITKEKLSAEVQAILADVPNKQNITDATLATQAKTIVGAINELTNKKGLLFLGVLGPNDPAPSNTPTKGYYLSFQASTKDTPYFNGVHLHRYSMLIWTQDEQGRWKFKKVKYEDHRGPKKVVIGNKIPIRLLNRKGNIIDGGRLTLGSDGTRNLYWLGEILRYRNQRNNSECINSIGSFTFGLFEFQPEDNGIIFRSTEQVLTFLKSRRYIYNTVNDYKRFELSKPSYKWVEGSPKWCPDILACKNKVKLRRIYHGPSQNYSYSNPEAYSGGGEKYYIKSKYAKPYKRCNSDPLDLAVPIEHKTKGRYNYIIKAYKRRKLGIFPNAAINVQVHAAGLSFNEIIVNEDYKK